MQLRLSSIRKEKSRPIMNDLLKTPYFLIQEDLLRSNIESFREAMDRIWPESIIAYSVKTNALPWIINWMNRNGV